VAPRRVRLPVLVAVAVATVGVLVLAFFLFRPADRHTPTATGEHPAEQADGREAASEPVGSSTTAGDDESGQAAAAGTGNGEAGTASAKAAGQVIVHVTGAVRSPSVVTLDRGARVEDAVDAAGGLKEGADAESVNLARVLADGEQIHIPQEGEEPAGTEPESAGNAAGAGAEAGTGADGSSGTGPDPAGAGGAAGGPEAAGQVDLNTADLTTLQTLPGVGPVTAEAIISHRQSQPFSSVEDLLLVKGIGPKTFESLKDLVTVG
jgi:competence protein ComEA